MKARSHTSVLLGFISLAMDYLTTYLMEEDEKPPRLQNVYNFKTVQITMGRDWCTIAELETAIAAVKAQYGHHQDLRVEPGEEYNGPVLTLTWHSDETDEMYNRRIAQIEEEKRREREMYERLKLKYEKSPIFQIDPEKRRINLR